MTKKQAFYKKKRNLILFLIIVLYIGTIFFHQVKELPEDVSYFGDEYWLMEDEITFLYDLTYQKQGEEIHEQEIFDTALQMIEEAEDFLVIDMFMVNDFSDEARDFPELSSLFIEKIRDQLKKHPDLQVVLITDEINRSYNSHQALQIDRLAEDRVEIIYTDLTKLRDSNVLYSGIWRIFFQWFGQEGNGWLPNPFGETSPKVTFRSYLQLLNIKANHRKAIITEDHGLILSANAHDSSAFHSNVAVQVTGPIIKNMVETERAVAKFSGGDLNAFPSEEKLNAYFSQEAPQEERTIRARILTEKQIETDFLGAMEQLEADDEIWIGMFYLSDHTVITSLLDAAERGVDVHLILDPNENAFGSEKIGLPNIPVAQGLIDDSAGRIEIKWYQTNEEQYHSKIAYLKGHEESYVTAGSTNFTSRNLDNYNLENNIAVTAPNDSTFIQDIDTYFKRLWNNEDAIFTIPHSKEEDALTPIKSVLYWTQKLLRFTTY
ncbi:phospholipase D family protein [Oceanobacillus alkalisoli]|uniref:phospholipase D family protein n=1 Tax=Oceanobacillus alkalisoli TaxID=2925113 RepID=UPI001F1205C9|nr:phospholipase D family protein [Oceanobacillus alkalisoli]MCF3943841.1 phospholipase D family protein [Oceanobacillus alkalisoli]